MTDPAPASPPGVGVHARVLAVVASIVGERPVAADATWRSLGLDSLDLLSLVTSIEDEFDLRIPDQTALRLHTVADVVALVLSSSR